MKVALAQMNSTLGRFEKNYKKAMACIQKASKQNCDLIIFPEAFLFGYPTYDLVENSFIVQKQCKYIKKIEDQVPKDIAVVIGAITPSKKINEKKIFNSALFIRKNKKTKFFYKELLPTYDVFNEARYLSFGQLQKNFIKFKGQKILISICEDIWAWNDFIYSKYTKNPLKKINPKDVDLIINISGSPFSSTKINSRREVIKKTASRLKAPLIYINTVGAQDELIFDGGSCLANKSGEITYQLPQFKESLEFLDLNQTRSPLKTNHRKSKDIENIEKALILGIKDFITKSGFKDVHLGLSGGIDSALVCSLATKALGSDRVTAIAMPGPYNSPKSLTLAKQLAKNLKVKFLTFDIKKSYEVLNKEMQKYYGQHPFGTTQENLQARIRGIHLMAYSNLNKSLLLNTSNKSELAVGYSTLYGDSCGGLCPIGDLLKTQVYQLCELQNKNKKIIPKEIITRPPSAELRPGQTDQQSLPNYDLLDKSIERLVVKKKKAQSKIDQQTFLMMTKSEFKRFQAPPILKISDRSFGQGRHYPIAYSSE